MFATHARQPLALAAAFLPLVAGCVISGGPGLLGSVSSDSQSAYASSDSGRSWSDDVSYVTYSPSPSPSTGVTLPSIIKLSANPATVTAPGQEIALTCEAVDGSGAPSYSWTATGGGLTGTQGQTVAWRSPTATGNYAVTVLVSSPSGGAVTGAFTIAVNSGGSATVLGTDPANPTPTPAPTPKQDNYPSPQPCSCDSTTYTYWHHDYWESD